MTAPVIATRVANALVEDAQRSQELGAAYETAGRDSGSLDGVLDRFRQYYGGLWVGGRLTLTPDELAFHPNAMNRLATTGTLDIVIDLRSVTGPTAVRFGMVTKIIAVPLGSRVFQVRCWGARAMADQIDAAVAAARSSDGGRR